MEGRKGKKKNKIRGVDRSAKERKIPACRGGLGGRCSSRFLLSLALIARLLSPDRWWTGRGRGRLIGSLGEARGPGTRRRRGRGGALGDGRGRSRSRSGRRSCGAVLRLPR